MIFLLTNLIAGAQVKNLIFYKDFISQENIKFISNKTYDLLKFNCSISYLWDCNSWDGTFKVPELYVTKAVGPQIAKRIITLKYIH
jgi:lipid-A-disaccharide synthase